MYASFKDQHEYLLEGALFAHTKGASEPYFKNLVAKAKAIANDHRINYRSQLIILSSHIFSYWSLESMNSFLSGSMSDANDFITPCD